MTDVVTIYTTAISAAAGISGAAISQYIGVIREGKQAKRDRAERHEAAKRDACEKLLRAAIDLRTQVANNRSFRGDRSAMTDRLEKVREHAAAAQVHAASVALLAPESVAEQADRLAGAAGELADWTAVNTNLDQGALNAEPDFTVLNDRLAAFRTSAKGIAGD